MRRGWVVGVDGKQMLPLALETEALGLQANWHNRAMFGPTEFSVMQTMKDKGVARFLYADLRGPLVETCTSKGGSS